MIKFEEYKNMIMDRAHQVSKQYGVEFEECVSVGYEIYVNALKKFDDKKGAKFGTYLFIQLNGIADEAKRIQKKNCVKFSALDSEEGEMNFEDSISSREEPDDSWFFERAKNELSYEAYRLLQWIVSFKWQNWDKKRVAAIPTKKMAIKGCGFTRDVVESAWAECESFWNRMGIVA